MKIGDLVKHDWWGMGIIIGQQGVVDRWYVRWVKPTATFTVCAAWGNDLEVLSENR